MSLSAQITGFGLRANQRADKVRRGVAIKLFSAIILDTPVDTGRLRGNWRVSVKKPQLEAIDRESKSGAEPNHEVIETLKPPAGESDLYLTNNLGYVNRIEFDGWSHTKAPQGMVRRNVIRFVQLIDEEAKKRGTQGLDISQAGSVGAQLLREARTRDRGANER